MSVQQWLASVKEVTLSNPVTLRESSQLASLFSFDLTTSHIAALQNDLLQHGLDIAKAVEEADFYESEWPGFNELVKSYLQSCKEIQIGPNGPVDIHQCFDSFSFFFADLQTAFMNLRGAVLESTVQAATQSMYSVAIALDKEGAMAVGSANGSVAAASMQRTEFMAALLLKVFNSIRSEKTDINAAPGTMSKKSIIFYVANLLCRLYFRLDTPGSCANVFSNIHTARISFSQSSRAQRVEFRYWLGRFYISKNMFADAYRHLKWAFDNCCVRPPIPSNPFAGTPAPNVGVSGSARNNKRRIYTFLVPAALLLGIVPTRNALEMFGLTHVYMPLVLGIKSGNYAGILAHLKQNSDWFLSHGLYIALSTQTFNLCARVLLYKSYKFTTASMTRKNIVRFDAFSAALRTGGLIQESDASFIIEEGICIALISQGFVKANVYSRNKLLQLKPSGAFPAIAEVKGINSPSKEQWMDH